MLNVDVRRTLLRKFDDLIIEKKESERLKKEFIDWINTEKPFFDVMNDSEREIYKNYPNLMIKQKIHISFYYDLKYNKEQLCGRIIFDGDEKSLLEEDNYNFYVFEFISYPAFFELNSYDVVVTDESNKTLTDIILDKLAKIFKVRKQYLEKRVFIKRVLESQDLTVTYLKKNYKDIYKLLENGKS